MDKENHNISIINSAGLLCIGIYSLGYLMYKRAFAELHILLPFLDFPIFVGEVLLLICFILFIFKCNIVSAKLNKWHYLLLAFYAFVLIKALCGYLQWGPLALRHSALFYYTLFIVFGYSFFNKEFFGKQKILVFSFLIFFLFFTENFDIYYLSTCCILAVILIRNYPNRRVRIILFIVLMLLIPYKLFLFASRMHIVGGFLSFVFLLGMLCLICNISWRVKLGIFIFLLLAICGGLLKFSEERIVKSIINIKEVIRRYQHFDDKYKQRLANLDFEQKQLKVEIYSPELFYYDPEYDNLLSSYAGSKLTRIAKSIRKEPSVVSPEFKKAKYDRDLLERAQKEGLETLALHEQIEVTSNEIQSVISRRKGRYGGKDKSGKRMTREMYNNTIFRLIIWKDLLDEMLKHKPIFGFDFGKPFRSIRLEVLGWGTSEWTRDGWIAVHNSYLHIFYRSGLIGILMIVTIFGLFFKLLNQFLTAKSITGVLLCTALFQWLINANSLLIFELPYTAIPIWSLFGMTLAYAKQLPPVKGEG